MIIGILGSASSDSNTRKGMNEVAKQLRLLNIEFKLIDLGVAFCNLQKISEYASPPVESQTYAIREQLMTAQGLIIGTPVYHGSFSGLLKNALDQFHNNAFKNLPVGIIASSGNSQSISIACAHLRSVVRALNGWPTPTNIGITSDSIVDGDLNIDICERISYMVNELQGFKFYEK